MMDNSSSLVAHHRLLGLPLVAAVATLVAAVATLANQVVVIADHHSWPFLTVGTNYFYNIT